MCCINKYIRMSSCLGVMMLLCLLMSFVACASKKEKDTKKKSAAIPLEEPENDYIVCDTLFEAPKLSGKKFSSPLIPMVWVEGGSFAYDRSGLDEGESKAPKDTFILESFYISKYEITQAQWQSVMKYNPSDVPGTNLPVDNVSWEEAVEFCNRLSEQERLQPAYRITPGRISCNFQAEGYRLLTEAEWEYAAKGGKKSKDYAYSGSNDIDEVAWYLDNSDGKSHPWV